MTVFTLKQDPFSNFYAVWADGQKVKNDIFSGVEDFEQELKALGYDKPYTIKVA